MRMLLQAFRRIRTAVASWPLPDPGPFVILLQASDDLLRRHTGVSQLGGQGSLLQQPQGLVRLVHAQPRLQIGVVQHRQHVAGADTLTIAHVQLSREAAPARDGDSGELAGLHLD